MDIGDQVIGAAQRLREEVDHLSFGAPVCAVYNPLDYAWEPYCLYVRRWGASPRRVIFLGMNPGPFGMAQVGVPFGEVAAVRDWVGIVGRVGQPAVVHPKRPVQGFDCPRSEVSGRRLWGLFAERFGTPAAFFDHHFVANYCPLLFVEQGGRNRTPDKLPEHERQPLFAACDAHLRAIAEALAPQWVVGIGAFAAQRAREALAGRPLRVAQVLHPSPASPAANRGWARSAAEQLAQLGIW